MARYRKIDSRIWNDEKFCSFSTNGKLLFLFILTHPNMTALGAMRASIPGLAAELGWSEKDFREAFREAFQQGILKIDEKASCLFVRNFLKYNQPESPNVVKAWASSLDLIPECSLKNEIIRIVKGFAKALPEAFHRALPEAFSKSMPYPEPEPEPEPEFPSIVSPAPAQQRVGIPVEVQLFEAITKRRAYIQNYPRIIEVLNGKTYTDVCGYYEEWLARNYKPGNLNWLDWVRFGSIPPQTRASPVAEKEWKGLKVIQRMQQEESHGNSSRSAEDFSTAYDELSLLGKRTV